MLERLSNFPSSAYSERRVFTISNIIYRAQQIYTNEVEFKGKLCWIILIRLNKAVIEKHTDIGNFKGETFSFPYSNF